MPKTDASRFASDVAEMRKIAADAQKRAALRRAAEAKRQAAVDEARQRFLIEQELRGELRGLRDEEAERQRQRRAEQRRIHAAVARAKHLYQMAEMSREAAAALAVRQHKVREMMREYNQRLAELRAMIPEL